jgi:hypothetical protein
VALRAAAPVVGLPVVALLLQQDPAGAFGALASSLFATPGRAVGAGLLVALVAVAMAGWAVPHVTAGSSGWVRHLPASETSRRRAAMAGLVIAQSPVLVAMVVVAVVSPQHGPGVIAARIAAVGLTMAAAALAVWPGADSRRSRLLAVVALLLAVTARSGLMAIALLLVVASERLAGPLSARVPIRWRRESRNAPMWIVVGVRALGSSLAVAPLLSLLPLAAMAAFRINNEDLSAGVAAGAARFGGGLAVAILVNGLVERLAVRRPAWSWSRSLPAGAARRIDEDAMLLGAPCLLPLAIAAWMDPLAAASIVACLPTLALRGAGAVRGSTETKMGPAARPLVEAGLVACWVALLPWLGLAVLAAAPLARRAAIEADRHQKVSLWEERRHATDADPMSWSAR